MNTDCDVSDTSDDAQAVWIDCHSRMSLAQKWAILNDMFKSAKMIHAAGVRHFHPQATAEVIRQEWLRAVLDPEEFSNVAALDHDPVG
jgi:hypothetical protein